MSERTMGLSQEKSQNTTLWANIATLAVAAGILMSNIVNPVIANNSNSNNNTCPHTGDWTKIDSADMTLYPVDGAVEYCFKAGNFLTDSIPEGGFGQAGACNQQNIQGCGLSHWSYRLGQAEPTPTDVQPTPTDVQTTPSPTPTTEPTPTDIPDNDPTPTPTPTVIQSDPTPTPTVVVDEPGETATPTPTSAPSQVGGVSDSEIVSSQDVLGIETLADTGNTGGRLINYGLVLLIISVYGHFTYKLQKSPKQTS